MKPVRVCDRKFLSIALIAFLFTILFPVSGFAGDPTQNKKNPTLKKPSPDSYPRNVTDPYLQKAWFLEHIGADEAWKTTEGSHDITIAFVDSGIDYNHPDLSPNLKYSATEIAGNKIDDDKNGYVDDIIGWDFVWGRSLPFDRSGHGTFLAGLAVAVKDNGIGSAGVCPKCSVMAARFLNWEGLGDTEDAIEGLKYATQAGASIINFSFSGEGYDRDMENAIKAAGKKDILVVVAASNDHLNDDHEDIYPAKFNLPNLITVAATDKKDELWEDSNWGKKTVHLAAPAVDVIGPDFDKYDIGSGTSDAAAIVSGAAGLIRSANPSLTAVQVKKILMKTVNKSEALRGKLVTDGVLNLAAAMKCATDSALFCLK